MDRFQDGNARLTRPPRAAPSRAPQPGSWLAPAAAAEPPPRRPHPHRPHPCDDTHDKTVVSLRRRGSRKRCKVSGERRARRLNGSAVLSHQPGSASAAPCSSRRRHAATAVRTKMPRSACATTIEIPPSTQPACTQARPHRSPMLMGVFEYLVCAWLGLSQPPQPTTQCAPLPAQPRRRAGPPDRRWPPQPPHATAATATPQPRHARTHATISYSA